MNIEPPAAARRGDSGGVAFDALLRALHPERERAAERYEEMRLRLRRFFRWRGGRWPDELADETIDRVARKLAGGEVIRAGDVGRYFLGVARNVLRESWQQERLRGFQGELGSRRDPGAAAAARETATGEDARLACLDHCLEELGADSRQLLLQYYQGEGVRRIQDRRALAAQMGVSSGTLRIRLHRLRARLEACVRKCLLRPETSSPGAPPIDEDVRK